jgi:hypothetical protein
MSGPRGIQLSGSQVIASVLATLTGAFAASYLGIGGTLVGAAVGSIASTMGTEIYKVYLQRSQERLRSAGQVLYHSAARTRTGNTMSQTVAGAASGVRRAASGGADQREGTARDLADQETEVWDRRQYGTPRDPHETQTIPGLATQRNGATNGGSSSGGSSNGGSGNAGAANAGAANGADRPGGTASQSAHGNFTEEGPAGDDAGRGSLWGAVTSFFGGLTRQQWLTYGGVAAGFFLVVVAAITVFELTIGKPLSAAVYGRHTSGTSVGDTFSGPSSPQQKVTTRPSSSPSATPTGSTPASPTPSAVTSSGTPTPSTSAGASSPATVPSSTTPTTGSSGAARSSTTATPTP